MKVKDIQVNSQKNAAIEKMISFYEIVMGLLIVFIDNAINTIKKAAKMQIVFKSSSGKHAKPTQISTSSVIKAASVMLVLAVVITIAPMKSMFSDFASSVSNVIMGNWTLPVITLTGENPMTIAVGGSYTEPGYTATDDVDGNITANVVITNNVNTNAAGTYTVEYTVSDSSGNSVTVIRTVEVASALDEQDFDYTGNVQEFIVPVSGEYKLEVWGAQGGKGESYSTNYVYPSTGGMGGYSTGIVYLTKGTVLYVQVGSQGGSPTPLPLNTPSAAPGGYNGGGAATQYGNGGGGGGSDIRIGTNNLYYRAIAAGRRRSEEETPALRHN